MNFIGQGFQKHYRQTDKHADRCYQMHCHAAFVGGNKTAHLQPVPYFLARTNQTEEIEFCGTFITLS